MVKVAGKEAAEWVWKGGGDVEGVKNGGSGRGNLRHKWGDQAWSRGSFSVEKGEGRKEGVDFDGFAGSVAVACGFGFLLMLEVKWPVHDGVIGGVGGQRYKDSGEDYKKIISDLWNLL